MTGILENVFLGGDAQDDDSNSNQHLQCYIILKAQSHHLPALIFPFVLHLLPKDEKGRKIRDVSYISDSLKDASSSLVGI